MLKVDGLNVAYGKVPILRNICLRVNELEIVSIVGSNGSGKTTLIKSIIGQVPYQEGSVEFRERNIDALITHERVQLGIACVPEGRGIFTNMTVLENLEVAGCVWTKGKKARNERLEGVNEMFPILGQRREQKAGTLSGGEAQMLAIGRCLMGDPKLMMMDEPSLGLGPIIVGKILDKISDINKRGITIILVEQNIKHSLEISKRGYVLENGKIVMEDASHQLLANEHIRKFYLGI